MSERSKRTLRVLSRVLFVCYLILLLYFLFFYAEYGRADGVGRYRYNLQPFQEIERFWIYRKQVGNWSAFLNLAGNVIGFMPFGFLFPLLGRRRKKAVTVIFTGFLLSLAVETLQLLTGTGIFDVDDLMLNTLGTALGFLLLSICHAIRRTFCNGKKI